MNKSIFRQVSLDRLSSPEQLDQMLRVTNARTWAALGAVVILLIAAGCWAFMGRVVTSATGTGVIVRQGGILNIVSNGSGIVVELKVAPGSRIRAHQVVATVAQPSMVQQLALLQSARDEAARKRAQDLSLDQNTAELKIAANARQHANLLNQIAELDRREQLLSQQITVEEELYSKGLVTNQQVLDMRQKLVDLNDQVATANAQLKQLEAERFAIAATPRQEDLDRESAVSAIERQIATARGNLQLAQEVVSPYEGEVLEIKTSPGSTVSDGQPILSIQPNKSSLEVLAYIPSQQAKDVRAGMDAQISPSNVKREQYGFIRGRVGFAADYPATQESIMRNFENDPLMRAVSAGGPVTEIDAMLLPDVSTASGFAWSTSRGPGGQITSGTICRVDIVTKRERPIDLVLPYLKLPQSRNQR